MNLILTISIFNDIKRSVLSQKTSTIHHKGGKSETRNYWSDLRPLGDDQRRPIRSPHLPAQNPAQSRKLDNLDGACFGPSPDLQKCRSNK